MKHVSAAFLSALLVLAVAGTRPARAQNNQLNVAQAAVVATTTMPSAYMWDVAATMDAQDNTYLTGSFIGTVSFGSFTLTSADNRYDVFVAKRDAAGAYLWAVQGGGPGDQQAKALAVDAGGNVYVTGNFTSVPTATFGSTTLTNAAAAGTEKADVFVAKVDGTTHAWQWAASAGGGTFINGDDYGTAIAVDGLGNVYVAGSFNSSVAFFGTMQVANTYPGFGSVFLAKLTPAGAWVWVKGQGYLGSAAAGLTVDAFQNVYLTGNHYAPATFGPFVLRSGIGEVFVAKIDGAGAWQWATGTGPMVRLNSYPRSVNVSAATSDGAGGLYVAGNYGGGLINLDTLILGGTVLVNNGAMGPRTQSGASYRTRNGYVARLDAATGAWRWAVQSTGAGDEFFGPPRLDGEGHVYVSGSFAPPPGSFPGATGSYFGPTVLNSAGGSDVVVAQLDTAGRWQWARQSGGSNSEHATLCSIDAQGRGVLAGTFTGVTDQIGPFTLAQFSAVQSWWTYFVATLGPNGAVLVTRPATATQTLEVFPNPTRNAVSVAGAPPGQPVRVLDVLGRQVLTGQMPAQGLLHLALPAGLPAGVYLVRAGAQARRLVVE